LILQCQSPVFRALAFTETIELDGTKDVIYMFCSFIYSVSHDLALDFADWLHLSKLFFSYQMNGYYDGCTVVLRDFLHEKPNIKTIIGILQTAENCKFKYLYQKTLFILATDCISQDLPISSTLLLSLSDQTKMDLTDIIRLKTRKL